MNFKIDEDSTVKMQPEATMQFSWPGSVLLMGFVLCLASAGLSQNEAVSPKQIDDPVVVIKNAIENQNSSLNLQKRRACSYTEIARSHYGTGESRSHKSRSDEVYFDLGGENFLQIEGAAPSPDVSSKNFDLWNRPLFQAILNHSVFSRDSDRISWDGRVVNMYNFAPDSAFKPLTDIDRAAQAIYGVVSVDQNSKIFVGLNGLARKSVYEGKRMLVLGPDDNHDPIPVFFYSAAPYDGVIVPTVWDEASFTAVKRGDNERSRWLATLTRTFVQIQSCRVYRVNSTIEPHFGVLDKSQEPQ